MTTLKLALKISVFSLALGMYSARVACEENRQDKNPDNAFPDLPDFYHRPSDYKVVPYIQAAILLQAMGKDNALKKLQKMTEEKGLHFKGFKVILLCRMLFTKKENVEFRRPKIGEAGFFGGTKYGDWALEPIEIVDGVPFLITQGYELNGEPESAKAYLEYCVESLSWNMAAFPIPTVKQRQTALRNILADPRWKVPLTKEEKDFLTAQCDFP